MKRTEIIGTRVHKDGCPRAVQLWVYDGLMYWYDILLFNGSWARLTKEIITDHLPNYDRWDDEAISIAIDDIVEKDVKDFVQKYSFRPFKGYLK